MLKFQGTEQSIPVNIGLDMLVSENSIIPMLPQKPNCKGKNYSPRGVVAHSASIILTQNSFGFPLAQRADTRITDAPSDKTLSHSNAVVQALPNESLDPRQGVKLECPEAPHLGKFKFAI